jgi:hypothetical protein
LKPFSNWRTLGSLIGVLLAVGMFAALAATSGAAAAPANPAFLAREWTPTPNVGGIAIPVVDTPPNAWVQVQWSTWAKTNWYPVDAWSGPLAQNDYGWGAVWYEEKDYGTGPFRWVVFDGNPAQGGQVWGMSIPFYLGYVGSFSISEITKGLNLPKPVLTVTPDPRMSFYSPKGAELKANPEGCGHYTIAGEVLSATGQPLSNYRVRITYPTGATEIVNAGGAPNYGRSGFAFILGAHRPGQAEKLELLPIGQDWPVSPAVTILFSDNCNANYAWVVFRAQR